MWAGFGEDEDPAPIFFMWGKEARDCEVRLKFEVRVELWRAETKLIMTLDDDGIQLDNVRKILAVCR